MWLGKRSCITMMDARAQPKITKRPLAIYVVSPICIHKMCVVFVCCTSPIDDAGSSLLASIYPDDSCLLNSVLSRFWINMLAVSTYVID